MKVPKIEIPKIPEEEKTPIISPLLGIIEQQSVTIQLQAEQIQLLKDEIARLKGQKPKPKIRPSKLEKDPKNQKEKESSGKRPGSHKRRKTADLPIREWIPPGSILENEM